ncbi:HAD-IIA family hydrolase [Halogeometricum borinquense]|uniref:HAD-IIA family hydrolase n=1 Tax=Halogeometricum borinquense TaxID=60847 RepID=A0A6C0UEL7_9EURY|nr:HAD-IIA family hydrolase [Halogeometricum borinquense]QIB73882.1 HAD-IIA family hydrolase [Halogeometricum borinquense]QIQ76755.1 HAD-IIA family hydrolase [Halogeometricum borinquense]
MTYRGVILDVDGTVVRGDEPIPRAGDGLDAIDAAGLERVFVSNNPTKRPAAYVERFARAGFEMAASEVITAGTVTARYLSEERPDDDLFVVGESGLVDILTDAGLSVVEAGDSPDTLVASVDEEFDYDSLCEALWTLSDDGVAFIGTDPDTVIPAAERDVPGSGAIINAIAGVAERDPDVVLGKPSDTARDMALEHLGVPAESVLVVGDRLDTDIALGERAGMTTALVKTGVTDEETLAASSITPDYVLDSLGDVSKVLTEQTV